MYDGQNGPFWQWYAHANVFRRRRTTFEAFSRNYYARIKNWKDVMKQSYVKAQRIWLKSHPELNEKWIQKLIGEDPAILGLGELDLIEQERRHPRSGRLDLLMRDDETGKRYEIELQVGATDESHIIRTIDYWDQERRRYPKSPHCAVIVAEEVNGRFLNVIEVLNGAVPFIAIQMQVFQVGEHITVVFTKVVDEVNRGSEQEDDEEVQAGATDRAYWEIKASPATVAMADDLLQMLHQVDPAFVLTYKKHYIGLAKDGESDLFILCRPKKNFLNLELRIPHSDELDSQIKSGGLELMAYSSQWDRYKIHINRNDIIERRALIIELMQIAYNNRKN